MRKLGFAALAAVFPLLTAAMSVRPMSTDELTRGADCVVVADVVSSAAAWDASGTRIDTVVTLAVRECWKGSPAGVLSVRVPGGTVGDVTMHVGEAPTFHVGEKAVCFLRPRDGALETYGWFRGKYTVVAGQIREMRNKPLPAFKSEVLAAVQAQGGKK